MEVTPLPIVTEVRPVQKTKAAKPISVTPLPIVTEVRPSQSWKACVPMVVTLLGMVMEVRLPHWSNILNIDNQ